MSDEKDYKVRATHCSHRAPLDEIHRKLVRKVDHKEGEPHRIGYGRWLDIHEVLEAPKLFGIAKVELDLEAELVVFDE